jgi:hypothetical protein
MSGRVDDRADVDRRYECDEGRRDDERSEPELPGSQQLARADSPVLALVRHLGYGSRVVSWPSVLYPR